MRSLILVILSAVGLAGLFMGYWAMQPSLPGGIASARQGAIPPPPGAGAPSIARIHVTDNAWMKQYDARGQLSSEFRGDQYLPKPDGTVDVTHPVARFFLANHQHLEIHGDTGNVVLHPSQGEGGAGLLNAGPPAPPTRGRLDHVVVNLVDETTHKPTLTMTTHDAVFDNETFRISTEGYRDSHGHFIADDQVPVHVTGQIEMEGRGLTVRWNDRDGRLELLEIAHGEVLKINDPANFSLLGGPKKTKFKGQHASAEGAGPMPQMLASRDRDAAGAAITTFRRPQTQPHRAKPGRAPHGSNVPVIYLASFYDNVKVTQPDPSGTGDQIVINNVDRMDVDFLLKQSSTSPATRPSASEAEAGTGAPAPSSSPAGQAGQAAAVPATQPDSQNEPPIYVHWTGVLRITPLQASPPVPLKSGDAAITLIGAPVRIHRVQPRQQGTDDIRCASVLYLTDGENVWLGHSARFPRIFIDQLPGKKAAQQQPTRLVSSGTVKYSRAQGEALLSGPGQGRIPLDPDPKDPHPFLNAAWMRQARFDFTQPPSGAGAQQPVLRFGHFEGNVDIRHPRMTLRSQSLDLLFDPKAAPALPVPSAIPAAFAPAAPASPRKKGQPQAQLRQAIATTDVWCELLDSAGKKQTIESDRLVLDTGWSAGKLYARHVNATGAVHVHGDDDLRARYLDVLLKPAKAVAKAVAAKPKSAAGPDAAQAELDRLVARDHVVARSKDGSVATGDELLVTTVDGRQRTVLSARSQARVTDPKGNIVSGPQIQFDGGAGQAHVIGPGSLHAMQQGSTTQPAQPVDVRWASGAEFDGAQNRIDAFGSVMATSTDRRGFVDEAVGEQMHIDLRKKPAPPSTRPVRAAAAEIKARRNAAKPAAGSADMDLFKDKEVVAMTIRKNAVLKSTRAGPDGAILQQFVLAGPTIIIRQIAPDGTSVRSVTVPAPGKMLVRDHRPPNPRPAPSSARGASPSGSGAGDDAGGTGSARGATAFEWQKNMVYNEAARRADMRGQVVIVHQDEDAKQPPVRVDAEHVIAFFEPTPPRQPASQANRKKGEGEAQMQLKYLTAEAGARPVVVTRGIEQMAARQVDYDPRRQVLIATGSPVVFHSGPTQQTQADRMEWDTATWNPRFRNAIVDYRPPVPEAQQPKRASGTRDPNKLLRRGEQP